MAGRKRTLTKKMEGSLLCLRVPNTFIAKSCMQPVADVSRMLNY